ncbi:MAG: 3-oxoacyl-ACP reductase FabG [Bryobacterales bacterium]|nr:3-oxoacyl-ACP reductase FabG [Bryobacterales bacterium]
MGTRVALVTGSSRGIGKAIALRLGSQGIAVCVNYKERKEEAEQVARRIAEQGGRAVAIGADLAKAGDCAALVERCAAELGPADILVNNAGVLRRGDLLDFDLEEMEAMRSVNVDGLVRVTRAAAEGMRQGGWGRIVNLTSVAALGTSMAGTTFYAATKAAVITLTRRFALELGSFGITVNAVAPGFILTDMASGGRTGEELQKAFESVAAKAMMRRVGKPEDIAAAVSFLVSEDAGFITAQVLTVDGGRTDFISHM